MRPLRRRSSSSIVARGRFLPDPAFLDALGEVPVGAVINACGRSPTSCARMARLRAMRASRLASYSFMAASRAAAEMAD